MLTSISVDVKSKLGLTVCQKVNLKIVVVRVQLEVIIIIV